MSEMVSHRSIDFPKNEFSSREPDDYYDRDSDYDRGSQCDPGLVGQHGDARGVLRHSHCEVSSLWVPRGAPSGPRKPEASKTHSERTSPSPRSSSSLRFCSSSRMSCSRCSSRELPYPQDLPYPRSIDSRKRDEEEEAAEQAKPAAALPEVVMTPGAELDLAVDTVMLEAKV